MKTNTRIRSAVFHCESY